MWSFTRLDLEWDKNGIHVQCDISHSVLNNGFLEQSTFSPHVAFGPQQLFQWATLARTWWIYDANCQCPFKSADRLVTYMTGRHKPVYHPFGDIGDHVVVINTRHIAMKEDYWRTFKHFNHTKYAGGFSRISAWRVHEMDPTRILEKACYQRLSGLTMKKTLMARLHLYPDEEVPEDILNNVSGQISQVQVVPKRLEDYTQEEIDSFPRLFEWPEDHDVESYKRENQQEPNQHTSKKWRLE